MIQNGVLLSVTSELCLVDLGHLCIVCHSFLVLFSHESMWLTYATTSVDAFMNHLRKRKRKLSPKATVGLYFGATRDKLLSLLSVSSPNSTSLPTSAISIPSKSTILLSIQVFNVSPHPISLVKLLRPFKKSFSPFHDLTYTWTLNLQATCKNALYKYSLTLSKPANVSLQNLTHADFCTLQPDDTCTETQLFPSGETLSISGDYLVKNATNSVNTQTSLLNLFRPEKKLVLKMQVVYKCQKQQSDVVILTGIFYSTPIYLTLTHTGY